MHSHNTSTVGGTHYIGLRYTLYVGKFRGLLKLFGRNKGACTHTASTTIIIITNNITTNGIITNHQPSKIFERIIANRLNEYFECIFHESLSAFRSGYSCQDTLLALVEKWKSTFRNNKCAGAILMDLSESFDCMDHDLLIAKLDAYGITTNSLKLLKSCLTNRQQRVKIGNTSSEWEEILKWVPQGSIIGPILFNIFINDMFHFITRANLVNYADDNTICSEQPTKQQVVEVLRAESNLAIEWFTRNLMLANPQKFQALFLNCKKENFTFYLDNVTIIPDDVVKLLGVHLDSK